jgi:hypothetical protein
MDLVSLGRAAGGVDYATVSAAIKRLEGRMATNQWLGEKVAEARRRLYVRMGKGDLGSSAE